MKSTNYFNTFIKVSEDCPARSGIVPPSKIPKSVPELQYEMIIRNPYQFTSDEVVFYVYQIRYEIHEGLDDQKAKFLLKGQPCLRTSPLSKRYGWGIHSNAEGKIALFQVNSPEYKKFLEDPSITKLNAMKSKRS